MPGYQSSGTEALEHLAKESKENKVQEDEYGNPLPNAPEGMFSTRAKKKPPLEHDDGYGNDLPE